jgi:hypothetical protein
LGKKDYSVLTFVFVTLFFFSILPWECLAFSCSANAFSEHITCLILSDHSWRASCCRMNQTLSLTHIWVRWSLDEVLEVVFKLIMEKVMSLGAIEIKRIHFAWRKDMNFEKLEPRCYHLKVYVLPQFICWNPDPIGDSIRKWGLLKIIKTLK